MSSLLFGLPFCLFLIRLQRSHPLFFFFRSCICTSPLLPVFLACFFVLFVDWTDIGSFSVPLDLPLHYYHTYELQRCENYPSHVLTLVIVGRREASCRSS